MPPPPCFSGTPGLKFVPGCVLNYHPVWYGTWYQYVIWVLVEHPVVRLKDRFLSHRCISARANVRSEDFFDLKGLRFVPLFSSFIL